MTKSKTTKKALFASALSLILCFAMLLGTTYAWFTDSVTNSGNKIQAGTLDVKLLMADSAGNYNDISDSTTPIFGGENSLVAQNNNADTLWEPGKTQVAYFAVKNNGNLALKYKVSLDVIEETKELSKVMQYTITPNADPTTAPVEVWDGTDALDVGTATLNGVTVAPNETNYFALSVHMKEVAGNEYQGGNVTFDITVLAAQATQESDSFDNQYDKNAIYPEVQSVSSLTQLKDALANGASVALKKDIVVNDTLVLEDCNTTIDLANSILSFTEDNPLELENTTLNIINSSDGSDATIVFDKKNSGFLANDSVVNFNGVNLEIDAASLGCLMANRGTTINLNDSTITVKASTSAPSIAALVGRDSTINVNNSRIVIENSMIGGYAITLIENGNLNLNSGSITVSGANVSALNISRNAAGSVVIADDFVINTNDGAQEFSYDYGGNSVTITDNRS